MREDATRELVLNGAEAGAVREALDDHEPGGDDNDEERADLAARFDVDLDGDTGTFELARADARLVLGALETRERVASGRETERLAALRERFAETFDFEERKPEGPSPVEDEEFPGST